MKVQDISYDIISKPVFYKKIFIKFNSIQFNSILFVLILYYLVQFILSFLGYLIILMPNFVLMFSQREFSSMRRHRKLTSTEERLTRDD